MLWKKLIKTKTLKIKRKYLFPNQKGWVKCQLNEIELTDNGPLLHITLDKYDLSVYYDNIKKGDLKW